MVQQKMMMPPPTNDVEAQQQTMTKFMMVFMGLMFYKLPSGLCVYFIASSIWGLTERQLLPKKKTDAASPDGEQPPGRGKSGVPKPRSPKDGGNGNGGTIQRVRNWWADVLEQASKNPRKIERGKKRTLSLDTSPAGLTHSNRLPGSGLLTVIAADLCPKPASPSVVGRGLGHTMAEDCWNGRICVPRINARWRVGGGKANLKLIRLVTATHIFVSEGRGGKGWSARLEIT